MKRTFLFGSALIAASAALFAYGVSPSQYNNGRSQDQANNGIPNAPAPNPVPGNAIAPGAPGAVPQLQFQQPAQNTQQDYDAMAVPDWAKAWHHYHWEEAKAAWESKEALFIDARAKVEYDQAHNPGAIPKPVGEFDKYFDLYKDKIKKAKHLITYCHGAGCQLSNKVAQKLYNDKGLHNVGSFFGGWPQWQQHNMPVVSGPEPKK
jgi:rhodanese-related sulfurtransferase